MNAALAPKSTATSSGSGLTSSVVAGLRATGVSSTATALFDRMLGERRGDDVGTP